MPKHRKKPARFAKKKLLFCLLIIYVLIAGMMLYFFFLQQPSANGQLKGGQALLDNYLRKELDLGVSSAATYSSSPLKITKKLSKIGDVQQQIVSFPIKSDNLTQFALVMKPSAPMPEGGYPV